MNKDLVELVRKAIEDKMYYLKQHGRYGNFNNADVQDMAQAAISAMQEGLPSEREIAEIVREAWICSDYDSMDYEAAAQQIHKRIMEGVK